MNSDRADDVYERYFADEQVMHLTGLSHRQMRYWEKTDVFAPSIRAQIQHMVRLYSFRDVVGLRVIARLRRDNNVRLDDIRRVSAWLKTHPAHTWANITLYVGGSRVFIEEPESGLLLSVRPANQYVFPFALEPVVRAVSEEAKRVSERQPDDIGRITQKRSIMHNEPVIAGTRIPILTIYSFHQAGYSPERIIEQYPQLHTEDVQAAIRETERLDLHHRSA